MQPDVRVLRQPRPSSASGCRPRSRGSGTSCRSSPCARRSTVSRSTRTTSNPASAICSAASMPAIPPPTTSARLQDRDAPHLQRLLAGAPAGSRRTPGRGPSRSRPPGRWSPTTPARGCWPSASRYRFRPAFSTALRKVGSCISGLHAATTTRSRPSSPDVLLDQLLAGVRAHEPVVPRDHHDVRLLGAPPSATARHVDRLGDVGPAVADVHADSLGRRGRRAAVIKASECGLAHARTSWPPPGPASGITSLSSSSSAGEPERQADQLREVDDRACRSASRRPG